MENWFTKFAKHRIRENKNLLGVFLGSTGSGKTYCSLRYAENIDKKFNIDRVVFSTKEFMTVLNSGLKSGSVVVYDEVGVGHSARGWYNMANRLFNYVLQTFRHRNIIVLFSTPDMGFVDKQARKLIHITFETTKHSVDREEGTCKCKPLIASNAPTYDKIYRKYPRIVRNGRQQIIKRVKFKMPSPELVEAYEKKKDAYTAKLNKEILATLSKEDSKKASIKELKKKVEENIELATNKYRDGVKYIDKDLIRANFKISDSKARAIKKMLEDELEDYGKY